MKGKKIFSLRPSFYALFSGALLSIAINLFTNLFSVQKESMNLIFIQITVFIIFTLTISSASFIYLSLLLEENYERFTMADFFDEISHNSILRMKLWSSFLSGFISLVVALTTIAFWLFPTMIK